MKSSDVISGSGWRTYRGLWNATTALVAALTLMSCGGGGGGSAGGGSGVVVPPTPPPPPPPPPPQPVTVVEAIYAGTNNNGSGGNFVAAFLRRSDGTVAPLDTYYTQGTGRAALTSTPPRLNSLISEDSILAVDNRFLLVVNAGSNNITSFRINSDYSLTVADVRPSGGTSPVSLAYRNGVVYVANADEDGVFTGPPNQSGNITAMRLDAATGQLAPVAGFSLSLRARPADLEISPDGAFLLVSALNAGSSQLPQPTAAEISSFRIQADGTLATTPSGTGMSTQVGNAAGRNLPNAIGIETYRQNGRSYVIAAEARTALANGSPSPNLAALQTGSVSNWEIRADGSLLPQTQDLLLGPSVTSGPTQASFVAVAEAYGLAMVACTTGGRVVGIIFTPAGDLAIANSGYQIFGKAADPSAPVPLADADGYVDLAFNPQETSLYQLVGLRGRIDVLDIVFSLESPGSTSGLLPMDNLQGLAVVKF